MIYFEDKMINPALVAWVGDVKEVKRSKPSPEKGGEGALSPVFNFTIKAGWDIFKSQDYADIETCEEARINIINCVNQWLHN